jgi:hypothetical protein
MSDTEEAQIPSKADRAKDSKRSSDAKTVGNNPST